MMKSPTDPIDSSVQDDVNRMNAERRRGWQGQYQFSRPPHPSQFHGTENQVPRPTYYPDKSDVYGPATNYPAPLDPNSWQGPAPHPGGVDRYGQDQPSPAHSISSQYADHREHSINSVSSNGISGAAAAAAAAIAAAAHSAKASPSYQKSSSAVPPPPNAMHGKPLPVPLQRNIPFHPNYTNVQANVPPPSVQPVPQDPSVQNHSSGYQQMPGPPTMNRHMSAPQYPQWAPQQPNSMDFRPGYQQSYDSHPMQSGDRLPFQSPDSIVGPMSNASSHDSEESRPKVTSSARSSSQKLSALYEPEEPGRKEFIDRVLRYWEEKELPLKHAPMMGGRTLDLFVLYQHVKKKGFMQEVTRSKEWTEISSTMGLGSTSATGFTLKKQYCKYLYGFECYFERGEPEPQEALGRIIEANRKKKQLVEQNQKAAENSHHDIKQTDDPQRLQAYAGHHHEPFRPNHPLSNMPYHQQTPDMLAGFTGPGQNHAMPQTPMGPYDQQSGYPVGVRWQQNPTFQPHRPLSQPGYPYRSNGMQNSSSQVYMHQQNSMDQPPPPPRPHFDQTPVNHPPVQCMHTHDAKADPRRDQSQTEPVPPTNWAGSQARPNDNNPQVKQPPDPIASSTGQPSAAIPQGNVPGSVAEKTASADLNAPVPTYASASSSSTMTAAPSAGPGSHETGTSAEGSNHGTTPQPPPKAPDSRHPQQIEKFIKSPKRHPSNTPPLKVRRSAVPDMTPQPPGSSTRHMPYPPGSSTMGHDPYQPSPYHHPGDRPPGVYQNPSQPPFQQPYSPYHGVNSQPSDSNYYGQKRLSHSMEHYGPPNKISRPDSMYGMQYRDGYEMQRRIGRSHSQRNEIGSLPHHFQSYGASPHQLTGPGINSTSGSFRQYPPSHHPSYPPNPRHMHPTMAPNDSQNSPANIHAADSQKARPHVASTSDSATKFLQGLCKDYVPQSRPTPGRFQNVPTNVANSQYPLGSVETVLPALVKSKEKSGQDVGVIEAWQIVMALKSGLLAESTWALNALTILLHDDSTIRQIMLSQLPGLLHIIIEHYRYCLHKLFGIPQESNTPPKDMCNGVSSEISDFEIPDINEYSSKCQASCFHLNFGGKVCKYLPAPLRLQNPFSKLPVKMITGDDCYPLLLDVLWDGEQEPRLNDFVPIARSKEKTFANSSNNEEVLFSDTKCTENGSVELTFEDMLSIPSFIRCLAQSRVVGFDDGASSQSPKNKFTIFPTVEECALHRPIGQNGTDDKSAIERDKSNEDFESEGTEPNSLQHDKKDNMTPCPDENASHIQSCLGRFVWNCNIALLEEEAAGFPGNSGFKVPLGINGWRLITRGLEYVFPKTPKNKDPKLILRILSLSNVIRSLSCTVANHAELRMHQKFFKTISGTVILGHKHRIRHIKSPNDVNGTRRDLPFFRPSQDVKLTSTEPPRDAVLENLDKNFAIHRRLHTSALSRLAESHDEMTAQSRKTPDLTSNVCNGQNTPADCNISEMESEVCSNKCLGNENENSKKHIKNGFNNIAIFSEDPKSKLAFSSTVLCDTLASQDSNSLYHDPWWWECVRQIREDSLVTLANLSTSLDLSHFSSDEAMLTIVDACLHWAVCSSADAQDPFPTTSQRTVLSPQSLGIEILTKLSMKEGNVDLILATRPYGRLEKLFRKLTVMVGNRKDQTLREFSIVLLSNLSTEETAARAVALQTGAVSNLLSFLEECEETGLNNQRMFPAGQELVNCGTISYMMQRCALTLFKLAKLKENRPLFLKHHLRLLSLSMSSLLGGVVLSLISAVLYELSCEPPNR